MFFVLKYLLILHIFRNFAHDFGGILLILHKLSFQSVPIL